MNEIQKAILDAFDLGWKIGRYQCANRPISLDALKQDCASEFEQRDRLVEKFATRIEDQAAAISAERYREDSN
ncbi:hypothetical protein ACQ4M3_13130 [Leptolyngbya sp. AN03gr2]|uniref:hypothetical protein n=1 Tax=unclassified Leptolyngbya TaxID=2650499 RepID=UPI003D3102AF